MRCGVDVAPVRAEPRGDAEQVTQALRGEPLRVELRRDGWARVVTAYDYPGWVREDALEEGEGSADHIAFWVGEGRILHATGRDGLGVVEEDEPEYLRGRRRRFVRL